MDPVGAVTPEPASIPIVLPGRMLRLIGSVRPENGLPVARDLMMLNRESRQTILLVIDTTGGYGRTARAITTAIALSRAHVVGLVLTRALSAGFVVLQACHSRFALPASTLGVHHSYIEGPQMLHSAEHAEAFADLIGRQANAQAEVWQAETAGLAARTGLAVEEAAALMKQAPRLSAREALEYGMLDGILTPRQQVP